MKNLTILTYKIGLSDNLNPIRSHHKVLRSNVWVRQEGSARSFLDGITAYLPTAGPRS